MKSSKLKNSISITHKKRIEILLSYYSDVLHYLGAFNLTPEDVERMRFKIHISKPLRI